MPIRSEYCLIVASNSVNCIVIINTLQMTYLLLCNYVHLCNYAGNVQIITDCYFYCKLIHILYLFVYRKPHTALLTQLHAHKRQQSQPVNLDASIQRPVFTC